MKAGKMGIGLCFCACAGLLAALPAGPGWAGDGAAKSKGQTLYVPAYSHVLHGDRRQPFNLTVTLSVRNADPATAITLLAVDYYDSRGRPVRSYVKDPVQIGPLASAEFVVAESDTSGGLGASFLVRWRSEKEAVSPVVEAVMIGTAAAQGISFVVPARVIGE